MAHGRSVSSSSESSEGKPLKHEESRDSPQSKAKLGRAGRRVGHSFEILSEQSPLLSPTRPADEETLIREDGTPELTLDWHDEASEETKSTWYLILLTLSIGGLQIAWAVELSNGSPYLLSLGMSKALLAFVWIAGPLSGTLVQPYVGIRSDNCRVSWGKRKPFMLGGAAATIVSLMALAWTREIVGGFLGIFGADPQSNGVHVSGIVFATLFVYILDFAINTVQAGIRAFMVDNAPTHQQEDANAWAGRITGVGNILGYMSGYVDLPKIVPWLGKTQFQVLCSIASFALGSTVLISCLTIRERDPRLEGPPSEENAGPIAFFRLVFKSMKRLPPQIRKVCEVQFFSWMGWFPFLFYITTYIGQLYVNPTFAAHPGLTSKEIDDEWEKATRIGTFALLIWGITSFLSNIFLPFFIVPTYSPPPPLPTPHSPNIHHHRHSSTPGTPGAMSTSMTSFFPNTSPSHSRLTRLLSACQIPWLTLRRAWLLSHLLNAACLFSTFFITTATAATVLVGFVGIAWALTLWAPFALISAEISKRDTARRARNAGRGSVEELDAQADEEGEDQAGVILGLHNVAIAAPQIIATLVSSLIFKLLQKGRGVAYDDSVGWVLRFGGVAALVAAYMTTRVGEEAEAGGGTYSTAKLREHEEAEEQV